MRAVFISAPAQGKPEQLIAMTSGARTCVPGQPTSGAMRTEKESKVWGTATHVFNSPHAAVSILETRKGGYCSRHSHAQRVNRFIVQSGEIDVIEYNEDGMSEVMRLRLGPGDSCDVEAGVVHRFEVIEPGLVVEVYFPSRPGDSVSHDDIQRLDIGGMVL